MRQGMRGEGIRGAAVLLVICNQIWESLWFVKHIRSSQMLYERMRRKVTSSFTQRTQYIHSMLGLCWSAVYDTGPALVFHSGHHPAF